MSPLDLSVDLGRNDITFLLLSLRNGDMPPGRRAAAQVTDGANGEDRAAGCRPRGDAAGKTPAAGQHQGRRTRAGDAAGEQAAQVAPVAPRLFAGDGGRRTPAPASLGSTAGTDSLTRVAPGVTAGGRRRRVNPLAGGC